MTQSISNQVRALGAAIVCIGVPLGMYANYFTGKNYYSQIIMFVSIVCLGFKSSFRIRLNKDFKRLFFFQMLMLAYCYFTSSHTNIQYLFFHLYVLALIVVLSFQKDRFFLYSSIKWVFYLSTPFTILGLYLAQSGMIVGDAAYIMKQYDENYALEPFTVSSCALAGFFSCLCIYKKNRLENLLAIIIALLNVYLIFLCGKRTPMVVLVIGLVLYYYRVKNMRFNIKSFRALLPSFMALLGGFIILLSVSPSFFDDIGEMFTNIYNGIRNIMGDTSVSDNSGSAIVRYESRLILYEYIMYNFHFYNYFLGAGYMAIGGQFDNPLLQAYSDIGILGFGGYLYFVVIYPIKQFFKNLDVTTVFFLLCALYNVLTCISSGNPYMWNKYAPICLLILSVSLYRITPQKNN